MKISILVPTRKRILSVQELIKTIFLTAFDINNIEVIFYIDEDDKESKEMFNFLFPTIKLVIGPRIILSQCWNECYKISTGDILMHCGDDIRFRTMYWDQMVRKEFDKVPDRILQVFGDDGIQHQNLATHSFIHRNWVKIVGYFVPPYFSSDFNDTWLDFVARQLNRQVYLPTLVTEHMHWLVNKGVKDKTALENLERHKRDNVEELYQQLLPKRLEDIKKLKAFIEHFNEVEV